MDSNERFERWRKKYGLFVQVGKVGRPDADRKLRLAERNLGRAKRNLNADPDEALIQAETAMVNAADAVLAASGLRIRGKTGSHEARFAYPGLPHEFKTNSDRLTRARELRSRATYDEADTVARDEARDLVDLAATLVSATRELLA